MEEKIEQIVLRILSQVSNFERMKNRSLEQKTAKVLKAIEYLKANVQLEKNMKLAVGG